MNVDIEKILANVLLFVSGAVFILILDMMMTVRGG